MSFVPSPDFVRRSLDDLVQQDARAAAVFDAFGLPHGLDGTQALEDAALSHGVAVDDVVGALLALGSPAETAAVPTDGDLDALIRHIVDRHHTYVRRIGPAISHWLDVIVERHGGRHPELAEVRQVFRDLIDSLLPHMAKEEHILFPFIQDLAVAARTATRPPAGPFGTLLNPVRVMEADHVEVAALVERLRTLTRGYVVPADASQTYSRCYEELARLDVDLERHVRLENDVLFPEAMALEGRVS